MPQRSHDASLQGQEVNGMPFLQCIIGRWRGGAPLRPLRLRPLRDLNVEAEAGREGQDREATAVAAAAG